MGSIGSLLARMAALDIAGHDFAEIAHRILVREEQPKHAADMIRREGDAGVRELALRAARERVERGLRNVASKTRTRPIREIVFDNLFSVFNLVVLLVIIAIAGALRFPFAVVLTVPDLRVERTVLLD